METYWIADDREFHKTLQVTESFQLMVVCDTVEAKVQTMQARKWFEIREIS